MNLEADSPAVSAGLVHRAAPWAVVIAVLLGAAAIRMHALGRSAVRADEINFLQLAARGQTLVGLWRDPPWMNQIPFWTPSRSSGIGSGRAHRMNGRCASRSHLSAA
jgi:hypothetical protein